jgi:plastocyanin
MKCTTLINVVASLMLMIAAPVPVKAGQASEAGIHSNSVSIILEGLAPYYVPPVAVVPVGSVVTWTNPTPSLHSIRHDGCLTLGRCVFDSGALLPDGTFSIPMLAPGQYPYHCELHPVMRGTLVVVDPHAAHNDIAAAIEDAEVKTHAE